MSASQRPVEKLTIAEELLIIKELHTNILTAYEQLVLNLFKQMESDKQATKILAAIKKDTDEAIEFIYRSSKAKDKENNKYDFQTIIEVAQEKLRKKWGKKFVEGLEGDLKQAFLDALNFMLLIEIGRKKLGDSIGEPLKVESFKKFKEFNTTNKNYSSKMAQVTLDIDNGLKKAKEEIIKARKSSVSSEIEKMSERSVQLSDMLTAYETNKKTPETVQKDSLVSEKFNTLILPKRKALIEKYNALNVEHGKIFSKWPLDILEDFQSDLDNFAKFIDSVKKDVAYHHITENLEDLSKSLRRIENVYDRKDDEKEKYFFDREINKETLLIKSMAQSFTVNISRIADLVEQELYTSASALQKPLPSLKEFFRVRFIEDYTKSMTEVDHRRMGKEDSIEGLAKVRIEFYSQLQQALRAAKKIIDEKLHDYQMEQLPANIQACQDEINKATEEAKELARQAGTDLEAHIQKSIVESLTSLNGMKPRKTEYDELVQKVAALETRLSELKSREVIINDEKIDAFKKFEFSESLNVALASALAERKKLKDVYASISQSIKSLSDFIISPEAALPSEVIEAEKYIKQLQEYLSALPKESVLNTLSFERIQEYLRKLQLPSDKSDPLKGFKEKLEEVKQFTLTKMIAIAERKQKKEDINKLKREDIAKLSPDTVAKSASDEYKVLYLDVKCDEAIASVGQAKDDASIAKFAVLQELKNALSYESTPPITAKNELASLRLNIFKSGVEAGHKFLAQDNDPIFLGFLKIIATILPIPALKQYTDVQTGMDFRNIASKMTGYVGLSFLGGAQTTTEGKEKREIPVVKETPTFEEKVKHNETVGITQTIEKSETKETEEIKEAKEVKEIKEVKAKSYLGSMFNAITGGYDAQTKPQTKNEKIDEAIKVCSLVISFLAENRAAEIGLQQKETDQAKEKQVNIYIDHRRKLQNKEKQYSLDQLVHGVEELKKRLTPTVYDKLKSVKDIKDYDDKFVSKTVLNGQKK